MSVGSVSVVVGFPWRPTPDRLAGFEIVQSWYEWALLDSVQVVADSGHEEFSRAASRNLAVRLAQEYSPDVVVISDADTIPTPAGLTAAITAALNGGMHYPFDKYLYAGSDCTPGGNTGGIYVCRPDVWWAVDGMDERFDGYGGEDDAFNASVEAILGKATCHPGFAVSLWHDGTCRDIGSPRWRPNSDLALRYNAARRSPEAMRQIIAERAA